MPPEPSFDALMARLQAGEEDAATQLFRRFSGRLLALARSRLDPLLRQQTDPEDVMQSVFKSFFLRQAEGQWDLGGWDSLWSLLTVLTVRKCGRRAGYHRAARRDVRREVSPRPAEDDSAPAWECLDREPTPGEAAVLAETLRELLAQMDLRDRQIVTLRLQGYATAEVAAEAGCTQRTVQRVLERLRTRLERQQADGSEENCGSGGG
jgi:RNA polymerase sigma-70 factor (ECF subfamily)